MQKSIEVISANVWRGQSHCAVARGSNAILAHLDMSDVRHTDAPIRETDDVWEQNRSLSNHLQPISPDVRTLVRGGDHSIAMGTIHASSQRWESLRVL